MRKGEGKGERSDLSRTRRFTRGPTEKVSWEKGLNRGKERNQRDSKLEEGDRERYLKNLENGGGKERRG